MKTFLALAALIITISIACTGSKSASSPATAIPNTKTPEQVQPNAAATQEPRTCSLGLAAAPGLNGLRLGMNVEQVLAVFPGSKQDPELSAAVAKPPSKFGVNTFQLQPDRYGSKDKFTTISLIMFTLLDGRLSNLRVNYRGPEYQHVDKFVENVVKGTNLPGVEQWQPFVGMDDTMKVLKCSEFEVNAFIGGQGGNLNYVSLKDLVADEKLKDRRKKAKEQASPTPAP